MTSAIERHIRPALGERPLVELKPLDLQRFVAGVAEAVGPGTTRSVYAVLRSSPTMRCASSFSPNASTRHPHARTQRTEITTLQVPELHRLAAAVEPQWRPMVYVAATCGLRFSEIAGLRWGRVDLRERSITVVETAPQRDTDRAEPK